MGFDCFICSVGGCFFILWALGIANSFYVENNQRNLYKGSYAVRDNSYFT